MGFGERKNLVSGKPVATPPEPDDVDTTANDLGSTIESEVCVDSIATSDALLLARLDSMREYIAQASHLQALRELREHFPEAEVFLVGGSVRDAIVDCEYKDLDFCIRGVPYEELEAYMKSKVQRESQVVLVGRNFGIMKFRPDGHDGEFIDIAMPRTERSTGLGVREFDIQADHTLPIEEDLTRRDLTINAMALNVNTGELIDLDGQGLQDMKDGVIRAMGDPRQRFDEDRTRLLRALRFACKYGFDIEPQTRLAIQDMLPQIHIEREVPKMRQGHEVMVMERVVPWEAVGKEFGKSLEANPIRTLEMWTELGALELIAPEISALQHAAVLELEQPAGQTLHDRLLKKLQLLPDDASFQLKFAVLFHELGACSGAGKQGESAAQASNRLADQVIRRLILTQFPEKLNVKDLKQILLNSSLEELAVKSLSELEQIFFTRKGDELVDLMSLLTIHAQVVAGQDITVVEQIQARVDQIRKLRQQPQLIRNDVLNEELGINWGRVRTVVGLIRDKQLAGELTQADEAMAYARELIEQGLV